MNYKELRVELKLPILYFKKTCHRLAANHRQIRHDTTVVLLE